MAQQFSTPNGVLIVPGAYSSLTVANDFSGLATTGVLVILGEADGGPDYTLEEDLESNAFGPDQLGDVIAKYGSGNLITAFNAAVTASNDPQIVNSFSRAILVKTNVSTKASGNLTKIGGGTYATVYDRGYGALGNMFYFGVAQDTAEAKPSKTFTWINPVGTIDLNLRVNGGAVAAPATFTANYTPAQAKTALDGLADVDATGGAQRTVIPGVAGNLTVTASGNQITIAYTSTWTTTPSVGDTLTISESGPVSVIKGGSNQNVGAYVVTSASSNSIVATKLSDAGKGGAAIGVITAPINIGSIAVASVDDFRVYSPIVLTLTSSTVVDGLGKTLEVNELVTGTDLLTRCLYDLSTTPVTWISKTGSPQLITSSAEYKVNFTVSRQSDNVNESFVVGGRVGLTIGYTGTTASMTISDTTLATTVTGGSGANQSITLASFPTISDLVAYINTLTGYSAAAGSAVLGQFSPTALDNGTFSICTTFGNKTGRVKVDAYDFFQKVQNESAVIQIGNPAEQAAAGIPATQALNTFLSGGTKGGTTDSIVLAALVAMESLDCNFIVPCFSRNASLDIADSLTESSSTYTIDAINQAVKSHCLKMGQFKQQKDRQGFCSFRGSYSNAESQAASLASAMISCNFQDARVLSTSGIIQGQPWVGASLAAGMQAGAFYRLIFNKLINSTGFIQAAGDYKANNYSAQENALLAGLLVAKPTATQGPWVWVSDQTTYGKQDNNFVYNSIQAMYISNVIKLSTKKRIEQAFVGQVLSEVNASLVASAMRQIMNSYIDLKLLAPSDDAPQGFRNLIVRINGPALIISCEVRLATGLYWATISFQAGKVTQTSSSTS